MSAGGPSGSGMPNSSNSASLPRVKTEPDFPQTRPGKRHSDGMSSSFGDEGDNGRDSHYNSGSHPDGGQQFKRRRGNDDQSGVRSSSSTRLVPSSPAYHQSSHGLSNGNRQQQQQQPLEEGGSYGVERIPLWRADASLANVPTTATGLLQQSATNDGEVRVVPRAREEGGSSDPQQWGTHTAQDEPRLTCPVPICRQVFIGKDMIVKHMRTHNEQVCSYLMPPS